MAQQASNNLTAAEHAFRELCGHPAASAAMREFFQSQFQEAADLAGRPDLPSDERVAYCSQMAVWNKLTKMTKG